MSRELHTKPLLPPDFTGKSASAAEKEVAVDNRQFARVGGKDYDVQKLWELTKHMDATPADLKKLVWLMNKPIWGKRVKGKGEYTPNQVIADKPKEEYAEKMERDRTRIDAADLSFPILTYQIGERRRILDGTHRVINSILSGKPLNEVIVSDDVLQQALVPEEPEEKEAGATNDWGWTAVRITEPLRAQIIAAGAAIDDDDLHVDDSNAYDDYGRESDPHITVKYGLAKIKDDKLKEAVKGIGPGTAKITGLSLFDNDDADYKVLKLDITSADLNKLNKAVSKNVSCPGNTFPTYHAHATLAYLKQDADETKYIKDSPLIGKTFDFDSIIFRGKGDKEGVESTIKLETEEDSE